MSISEHQKPIETGLGPIPEPSEILADIDLGGKTALVTGGYSGIGLETVRALADAGAHVHVPARDVTRAQKALEGIIDPSHIDFMDLSDLPSVAAYGDKLAARHDSIDLAIFNAGVMACPLARTAQEVQTLVHGLGVASWHRFEGWAAPGRGSRLSAAMPAVWRRGGGPRRLVRGVLG